MIRVAVIGVGHWGPHHVRNFYNHPDSEVVWVVDRDEEQLASIRQHYKELPLTTNADQAIADENVDAIVIVTPAGTHYQLATAALAAGKHVFVEKPLARSSQEADALCRLACEVDRQLMVGHVFVHNRAVREAKKYLNSGELGEVRYIAMKRTNLGRIQPDVNVMWDVGTHDISIANYWLDSQPLAVSAHGGRWYNEANDEVIFATLFYPGNVLVNLHASWVDPEKVRSATIVGSGKMLVFNDMIDRPLELHDRGYVHEVATGFTDTLASFKASIREGDIVKLRVTTGEPLLDEVNDFLGAIQEARPALTPGTDGAKVVKVLEAIDRSLANQGLRESV